MELVFYEHSLFCIFYTFFVGRPIVILLSNCAFICQFWGDRIGFETNA